MAQEKLTWASASLKHPGLTREKVAMVALIQHRIVPKTDRRQTGDKVKNAVNAERCHDGTASKLCLVERRTHTPEDVGSNPTESI